MPGRGTGGEGPLHRAGVDACLLGRLRFAPWHSRGDPSPFAPSAAGSKSTGSLQGLVSTPLLVRGCASSFGGREPHRRRQRPARDVPALPDYLSDLSRCPHLSWVVPASSGVTGLARG
ncbi:MAG: hypothetical protein AVDCRST_MAG59-3373 [uncultured Thermomicrobiales bacterium]|uniref:Uncharacterized protein n=1 Tax=uncultured Thermomicrobiales bacterium TaxID=1645740 RepID=A0A6J4V602_9BACT|nr:MAG: hypothetical protein AVDCRST_MAG59-3373 [uncultured Thermomicrobiales bacterium]